MRRPLILLPFHRAVCSLAHVQKFSFVCCSRITDLKFSSGCYTWLLTVPAIFCYKGTHDEKGQFIVARRERLSRQSEIAVAFHGTKFFTMLCYNIIYITIIYLLQVYSARSQSPSRCEVEKMPSARYASLFSLCCPIISLV